MWLIEESIERIINWIKIGHPEIVDYIIPGLTDEEIETIVKDLPFSIPEELKCLYRYTNGISHIYNYPHRSVFIWERYALLTLQEAMERWKGVYANRYTIKDFSFNTAPEEHCYGSNCFPFLSDRANLEAYAIIDANDLNTCQVICTSGADRIQRRYISLTALFQTLADWYEQENSLDTGRVDANNPIKDKYFHTWKKYNTYMDLAAPFEFLDELYEWQSHQISEAADFDFIDNSLELTPDTSLESIYQPDEMDEVDKLYEWYLNQIDELNELYEWQSNQISATADFNFIDDSSEFTPDFRSSTIW
jgi:hypothetical protein